MGAAPVVLIRRCQGTPVVMPYFVEEKQDEGIDLQVDAAGWDIYSVS